MCWQYLHAVCTIVALLKVSIDTVGNHHRMQIRQLTTKSMCICVCVCVQPYSRLDNHQAVCVCVCVCVCMCAAI